MGVYTRRASEDGAGAETKRHSRIGSPCARALQQAQRRWLPNITDCSPVLHTRPREAWRGIERCLVRISDDKLAAAKKLVVGMRERLVGILLVTQK